MNSINLVFQLGAIFIDEINGFLDYFLLENL